MYNNIDVRNSYKQITEEFVNHYYTVYDQNIINLANMFTADSKFTWNSNEVVGFNNLLSHLKQNNITSVTHNITEYTGQPLGVKSLLITIVGDIRNDNLNQHSKFTESIILQYCDDIECFIIHNSIFTTIE